MGTRHHAPPGLKAAESGFGFRTVFCALQSRHLFLVTSIVPIAMVTQRHRAGSPMDVLVALLRRHPGVGTRLLNTILGVHVAAQCPTSGPSHGFGLESELGLAATPGRGSPPLETKHNLLSAQTCPGRILNASLER